MIIELVPFLEMAPDFAEILPSYESACVMVHGFELTLIQGKILNDSASKLSRILPTLKVKSLVSIIYDKKHILHEKREKRAKIFV